MKSKVVCLAVTIGVLAWASDARAQSYRVVRIQPLPGAADATLTDLNNHLQGVGFSGDRAIFWNGSQTFALPVPDVVGRLAINNAGVIVGTRHVASGRQIFALINASSAIDLPTPAPSAPDSEISVRDLTDSGIVLIEDRQPSTLRVREWALYQMTLFDLSPFGHVTAIGGDGRIATLQGCGFTSTQSSPPVIRWPTGRLLIPWSTPCAEVSVFGSGGHFAGFVPSGFVQHPWFYARPDESVIVIPPLSGVANGMALGGMNRAGDVVGRITQHGPIRDVPFVFAGERLIDLGELVGPLTDVSPNQFVGAPVLVTDDGVILTGTTTTPEFIFFPGTPAQAVLIPRAPGVPPRVPPQGLTFTVTNGFVRLEWRSSFALEYVVEAGSASGLSNLFNASVGSRTFVEGTVPPGRYFVRVRGRYANGVSEPSTEVVIDVR